MDASGGAGGIPGVMLAKRSAEDLMGDYSPIGSSPVCSPSGGGCRSISPGSNGDGDTSSAKLNSLYKEIGWLKIKLLSARDEHTENKANESTPTRDELQARLDSRVAEHAALLTQRDQVAGPGISDATPSPTPPLNFEAVDAEAVAEVAREELRRAQEDQHAPASREETRKAQLHSRLSRAGFLANGRSAPEPKQAEASELVITGEGVSETAGATEIAGGDTSVVQPSFQDKGPEQDATSDAHVPLSSPSTLSQSTPPLNGAVAPSRKPAETTAAEVSKAGEAVSARTIDVEEVHSSIGTLCVRIIAAHNLKNRDSGICGDVSDPFVVVRIGSVEHKTEVIDNDLNPVWHSEPFPFSVDLSSPEQRTVNLEVFNHNNFFAHKSLGTVRVDASGLTVGCWQQRREHLQDGGRGAELEFALLYTLGVSAAGGSQPPTSMPAPNEPTTATATDAADAVDAAQEPRQLHEDSLERSPQELPGHHEGSVERPTEEPPPHHEGFLERAKHGLAHMLHLDGEHHEADAADAADAADTSDATDSALMPEPEVAATLEPDLAPMPPMPKAAPPNRNSKKQLVKLRGLMNTLQKEAQASHKERAALENRARRLDKQLQAVQVRTMRSERAEDERKKAEAEMATLRRALNARLRKEAKRQPAVQPAAETPERPTSVDRAFNTMDLPLSARRSMTPVTSAADFPLSLRRDMGPLTPRMTRSLSRPETGRTKAQTRAVATRLRPRNASPTAATPSSPSQALPSGRSAVTDSAPSLTSAPLLGSPTWHRGCRLGPGLPATPRGESPFRQHSPPRAGRSPRRSSSPVPGTTAKHAGSSPPRERQTSPSTRAEGKTRQQTRHNAHVWRQPSEGSEDGSSALEDENLKWHEPRGHDEAGPPSVPQLVFDRVRSDVTVNSFGGNSPRGGDDEGGVESPSKRSAPSVVDVLDEGAVQRCSEGEWMQMQQSEEPPACYVATWEDSERGTSEVATLPPTPAQPVGRETLPGSAQPTVQSGNDEGVSTGPLLSWTTCTAADLGLGHDRVPSPLFDRAAAVPTRGSAAFSELGTSTATAVAAAVASASAVLSHSRTSSTERFEEVSRSQMGSANTADREGSETGMVFYPLAEEEPMTKETIGRLEGSSCIDPSPPTQQTRALAWRSPDCHAVVATAGETDPGVAAVVAAVASSAAVSSGTAPGPAAAEAAAVDSADAKADGSSNGQSPLLRLWSPPPAPRDTLGVATIDIEADGKQPPAGMRRANPRSQSRRNSPSPGPGTGEPAGRGDGPAGGARPASPTLAFGSRSPSRAAAGTSITSTAPGRKSSPGQRVSSLASDGLSGGTASIAAKSSGTGTDEAWHHRLATTHTKSSHARREKRNSPSTADLLEEAGRLLDSNQEPFQPFRRSGGSRGFASRSGIK